MPFKDPEKAKANARERAKRYRERYPEKSRKASREYLREKREFKANWVDWLKLSTPCMDCGGRFPTCCMDFDHRPDEGKVNTISVMVATYNITLDEVFKESAKCDLVCANCHRIRTFKRQGKPILCPKIFQKASNQ